MKTRFRLPSDHDPAVVCKMERMPARYVKEYVAVFFPDFAVIPRRQTNTECQLVHPERGEIIHSDGSNKAVYNWLKKLHDAQESIVLPDTLGLVDGKEGLAHVILKKVLKQLEYFNDAHLSIEELADVVGVSFQVTWSPTLKRYRAAFGSITIDYGMTDTDIKNLVKEFSNE